MSFLAVVIKEWVFIAALVLTGMAWHSEVQGQAASLNLTWTDTSDSEQGFKIERVMAGLVDTTLSVGPNVGSYIDSGLVAETIYCYRVSAFNSAGDSDPSNQACATAQNGTPPVPSPNNTSLIASPASIAPSGTITTNWTGIANPSSMDWIGLYAADSNGVDFIDWIYVSCSKTAANGQSSGSCPFTIPSTVSPGSYQLRLFANDGYTQLASSSAVTVSTSGTAGNASLRVSPTNIAPAGTVTASWSGIVRPVAKDWIGFYARDGADVNFIEWSYVSCSKTSGRGRSSGSCPMVVPSTVSAGTYELRLFANDGYTRLATSGPITVGAIQSIVMASATTGTTGGVRPAVLSTIQGPSKTHLTPDLPAPLDDYSAQGWRNYRLAVKLQSLDDDSIGVMFRYQDKDNYYRFSWDMGFRRLIKIVNGAPTLLAEQEAWYVTGQTYQLKIVAQGTALQVSIDGIPVFSVTDSSLSQGTIALYSWYNEGSVFDDLLVEDLATGGVLLSEDFNTGNFAGWTIVDDNGTLQGPSAWSAVNGGLVQSSNIGSETAGNLGTFALYSR